ncbi:MAG: nicotinamidase-related amidase [Candidatus Latescibacterota bacterium]|jgi:nicotinamidase-related amidase
MRTILKEMFAMLDLKVQYFQDSPPEGLPYREEHFIRRHVKMPLPAGQTALVLVDLWDNHFIESWLERAEQITREAVVPVLAAAREVGLTIVHAPSPPVAEQFEELKKHAPPMPSVPPAWPPAEFRSRQGEYAAFRGPRAQPPGIPPLDRLGMSPHIEVLEGEFVVATGEQLHVLLAERGILHLVYAGFATNWCILNRDYGMRAMAGRGYNLVLLREATAGVEFPDTVAKGLATEMAVREVEQQLGFSAANADFLAACAAIKGENT